MSAGIANNYYMENLNDAKGESKLIGFDGKIVLERVHAFQCQWGRDWQRLMAEEWVVAVTP